MHERSSSHNEHHFSEELRELVPGIEFEETGELIEARIVVQDALASADTNPILLEVAWQEYAKIIEGVIDCDDRSEPTDRAQLQIAALVHKALIFRRAGDMARYLEELDDAEYYAYNAYLDNVSAALQAEQKRVRDHAKLIDEYGRAYFN